MGRFGFSYIGFIFLLMLTVPNLIWVKNQPKDYTPQNESKLLLAFERIGQVCVTFTALLFTDTNPQAFSPWTLWLIAAVLLMVIYECWWIRYFRSERTPADFYSGFCGVPVAGATLPVAAFFLLAVYGRLLWLMGAAVVLGVGHIGIHLQHRRRLRA